MRRLVLLALSLLGVVGPANAENATIRNAIVGFIRPAYADLASSSRELADSMSDLCAVPDKANLEGARRHFRDAIEKWSHVETIRFGPIAEQNRLERIFYWPDRKGIGLKQIQSAIAGGDRSLESVDKLAGKSVALQGFGALEFVLYGSGFEELASDKGAHRCGYGEAVAANLGEIAAEVSAAWQDADGFAAAWANPDEGNPLYRDDTEALTELFEVFVHGLEQVRDTRINAFLGKGPENDDKPKSAPLWRSGATVAGINANLDGLRQLFNASALAGKVTGENAYLSRSIEFEFANAHRTLQEISAVPIAEALASPDQRAKLDYARLVTSSLSELFGVKLAAALNLSAGFSSLDGD